mgnify:CR=1 FL=1
MSMLKEHTVVENVPFGRKTLTFKQGKATLTQVTVTEKCQPGENEERFVERLLRIYADRKGTIQVVFKNRMPDYAIITFE